MCYSISGYGGVRYNLCAPTAKSSAAKTADPLIGMSGLLSAAAVAGAALTAYSARRVANERGDSRED